jgi:hypothetical protein
MRLIKFFPQPGLSPQGAATGISSRRISARTTEKSSMLRDTRRLFGTSRQDIAGRFGFVSNINLIFFEYLKKTYTKISQVSFN